MLNNVILVGRLATNPEIVEVEGNKKVTSVVLAVNRNFKNSEGLYDTDFIRCVLWNNVAASTTEYCRVGDVIGIKGRLQSSTYQKEEEKKYGLEVVAEKVTFLSSKKPEEETSDKKKKVDE